MGIRLQIIWKQSLEAPNTMTDDQNAFIIKSTYKSKHKIFKFKYFNQIGNINNIPRIILSHLFSKQKVKNKTMNKNIPKKKSSAERLDAPQNHISSSDSCSRSVFFRSPTSEEQNLLSRDLTNQVTKA